MDIATLEKANRIVECIRKIEIQLSNLDRDCNRLNSMKDAGIVLTFGEINVTARNLKRLANYKKEVLTNRKKEYEKILKNL